MFLLGFSEILGELLTFDDSLDPYDAVSPIMGDDHHTIIFTDALVVNKARWDNSDNHRKRSIIQFIRYYTAMDMRLKISLGNDLRNPRKRYLLQSLREFYADEQIAEDVVYSKLHPLVADGVAAPALDEHQREHIQELLTRKCLKYLSSPPMQREEL